MSLYISFNFLKCFEKYNVYGKIGTNLGHYKFNLTVMIYLSMDLREAFSWCVVYFYDKLIGHDDPRRPLFPRVPVRDSCTRHEGQEVRTCRGTYCCWSCSRIIIHLGDMTYGSNVRIFIDREVKQ